MILTHYETPFRNQQFGLRSYLANGLHLALREATRPLSLERKMALARQIGQRLVLASGRNRQRILDNLELIFPNRDLDWRLDVARQMGGALAQSMMEHMNMEAIAGGAMTCHVGGPGVEHLDPAKGAMILTGHFGQWEAIRLGWRQITGTECGIFFRPNNNGFWDRHWQHYLALAGQPVIPKGGPGREMMSAHLGAKGALMMLIDQAARSAERIDFMGKPARTSFRAVEIALEYDLPVIPAFASRRVDGTGFDVTFHAPMATTSPRAMTETYNALLGEVVRGDPTQYLWTHRRWR